MGFSLKLSVCANSLRKLSIPGVCTPFFWNRRTWALGLGAAIAVGFAFLVEITGHPSWAILLLIIAAAAPSGILLFSDLGGMSAIESCRTAALGGLVQRGRLAYADRLQLLPEAAQMIVRLVQGQARGNDRPLSAAVARGRASRQLHRPGRDRAKRGLVLFQE
jgi:hypothetical protein